MIVLEQIGNALVGDVKEIHVGLDESLLKNIHCKRLLVEPPLELDIFFQIVHLNKYISLIIKSKEEPLSRVNGGAGAAS